MSNLKKRKCLYIMIIVQSMIVTCCGLPYCDKTKFTEDELTWMEAYSEGETHTFCNQENGQQDTIHIVNKEIYNPRNTLWFDLQGCNWMEGDNKFNAIAGYSFTIEHQGKSYIGDFTIKKTSCDSPAKISVLALDNFSRKVSCNNIVRTYISKSQFITGVKFYTNQFDRGRKRATLDYLIWNKKKGLVAYKFIGDSAPYIIND